MKDAWMRYLAELRDEAAHLSRRTWLTVVLVVVTSFALGAWADFGLRASALWWQGVTVAALGVLGYAVVDRWWYRDWRLEEMRRLVDGFRSEEALARVIAARLIGRGIIAGTLVVVAGRHL